MSVSSDNFQQYPYRIAISGGRGRLARLVASFLRQEGYEVLLFSRREGEGFLPLEELFNPHLLATFDLLIHAAWSTVPFTSEEHQGQEDKRDLLLLDKILTTLALLSLKQEVPQLLFFSSAAVYGNTTEQAVQETAQLHPMSRYAKEKLLAERMILQQATSHPSLRPLILRITNVLGFLSDPRYPQGILPRIIAAAKNQEPLPIWGDGYCSKDYLWIDDFLLALQAALRKRLSGLFNLGSGEQYSLIDLVTAVEKALHLRISLQHHPRYAWDVARSCIDSSKFSQATGWRARCNIPEEIEKLLQ